MQRGRAELVSGKPVRVVNACPRDRILVKAGPWQGISTLAMNLQKYQQLGNRKYVWAYGFWKKFSICCAWAFLSTTFFLATFFFFLATFFLAFFFPFFAFVDFGSKQHVFNLLDCVVVLYRVLSLLRALVRALAPRSIILRFLAAERLIPFKITRFWWRFLSWETRFLQRKSCFPPLRISKISACGGPICR